MAWLAWCHKLLSLLLVFLTLCSAKNPNESKEFGKAAIGNINFSINDDRLNMTEVRMNETLMEKLNKLHHAIRDNYWLKTDDGDMPSKEVQLQRLHEMTQEYLEGSANETALLEAAQNWTDTYENGDWLEAHNLSTRDWTLPYLNAIFNLTSWTYWYTQGAYVGVGQELSCSTYIDEILTNKSEWDKMGSSAAKTLMALIPSLLAFGRFYVARSSELYATSALVGVTAAFYTFGLPIQSITAVRGRNTLSMAMFGFAAVSAISKLGEMNEKKGTPKVSPPLEVLQDWSRDDEEDDVRASFASIHKKATEGWKMRWHMWQLPAALVAGVQMFIFVWLIYPMFQNLGVPKFIFGCRSNLKHIDWTGAYIGVSAAVNTLFRYMMWENSSHERAKVYALSRRAITELEAIIVKDPNGETTQTDLPPLLPPITLRLHAAFSRFRSPEPEVSSSSTIPSNLPSRREHRGFRGTLSYYVTLLKWRLSYIIPNPLTTLRGGFGSYKGARRWRPIYVLIHLSTSSRHPLLTLLTGFVEAALLLVLTFFFEAQWGGNLVITAVAVALILVFITVGRALGLLYVWVSSRVWGLTVIDCDSKEEIRGALRIVCSMKGVLVVVNGATYFDGHRMDFLDGWMAFLEAYEGGLYDSDDDGPASAVVPGTGSLGSGASAGAGAASYGSLSPPGSAGYAYSSPSYDPVKQPPSVVRPVSSNPSSLHYSHTSKPPAHVDEIYNRVSSSSSSNGNTQPAIPLESLSPSHHPGFTQNLSKETYLQSPVSSVGSPIQSPKDRSAELPVAVVGVDRFQAGEQGQSDEHGFGWRPGYRRVDSDGTGDVAAHGRMASAHLGRGGDM